MAEKRKSSHVEFAGAPAWLPVEELRARIAAIRLARAGDQAAAFADLSAEFRDRFLLKSVRIEKLPTLLPHKRTRVTVDAARGFDPVKFCVVMPPMSARLSGQYRFPPNALSFVVQASLFSEYKVAVVFHRPHAFLNAPRRSYALSVDRSQRADRPYKIATVAVGHIRVLAGTGTAVFQSVAPASNWTPAAPPSGPVQYYKVGLPVTAAGHGLHWAIEPMLLAGRLRGPNRWFNAALRGTVACAYPLPHDSLATFKIGGIISRYPIPDPEKFYVTHPLVWGVDFLSQKKQKNGIHPAGSDFFAAVTVKRTHALLPSLTVSPFVNAGWSTLSRVPPHSSASPASSHSVAIGVLLSCNRWGTVDCALTIPIHRSQAHLTSPLQLLVNYAPQL
jgi:hypothetical protein